MATVSNNASGNDFDDADFGDFQACDSGSNSMQSSITTFKDDLPPTINPFKLDEEEFGKFVAKFDEDLQTIFPGDDIITFNQPIRSQEDLIDDCPIWCNLTGSYRCRSPLSFGKSITNKHFIDSLKLQDNVTTNDAGKVDRFEEEDIACDLDMHSLIIGSYEQELDNEGGDQQAPGDGVQSADQVIEEIEKYIDGDFHPGDGFTKKADGGEDNPLLSLNASTLLNVVLKSWEEECAQSGDTSNTEGEYYSLPAHINHTTEPIANNSAPNEGDHQQQPQSKEVSLTLKASNIYLNAKMSSNAEYEKIYKKNNQIIQENQAKTGSTVESECLERLRNLNTAQLNELYIEIEAIISFKSEILCQELARRDELEFEKELKNKFISILLSVQNKRRNYFLNADLANNKHVQRKVAVKRRSAETSAAGAAGERKPPVTRLGSSLMARALDLTSLGAATLKESLSFGSATPTPVFLTTVIPYRKDMHPIDVPTMQMLIKLLIALNENNSTVPALLTDYILKVICL